MTDQELIDAAVAVRDNAYCPYSDFSVGAALVDDQGQIHIGCNVENAAFPQGNCAEASAIGAMVSMGGKAIVTIAVAGGVGELRSCAPCGGCRQRINEFANDQTRVIAMNDDGNWHTYSMSELLPASFHL
jgi:cytidine deaminase